MVWSGISMLQQALSGNCSASELDADGTFQNEFLKLKHNSRDIALCTPVSQSSLRLIAPVYWPLTLLYPTQGSSNSFICHWERPMDSVLWLLERRTFSEPRPPCRPCPPHLLPPHAGSELWGATFPSQHEAILQGSLEEHGRMSCLLEDQLADGVVRSVSLQSYDILANTD